MKMVEESKNDAVKDQALFEAEMDLSDLNEHSKNVDIFVNVRWDWCVIGSAILKKNLLSRLFPNVEGRKIDVEKFICLLSSSLSLDFNEKMRIINEWPNLTQFQCDELLITFEDERHEFNKLVDSEKHIILELLFTSATTWIKVLYGEGRMADAVLVDVCCAELVNQEVLPISPEVFERDDRFYIFITNLLINACADEWLCKNAIKRAIEKRLEVEQKQEKFWRELLEKITYRRGSVQHTRHAYSIMTFVYENMIREIDIKEAGERSNACFELGKLYAQLKDFDKAKEWWYSAHDLAIEANISTERRYEPLLYLLDMICTSTNLESADSLLNSDFWSIVDEASLPHIFQNLSVNLLFLGQAKLALELAEHCIDSISDENTHRDLWFNLYTMAATCGDGTRADKYLQTYSDKVLPKIFAKLNEQKSETEEYFHRLARSSFSLYMAYLCSPSDTLKEEIESLFSTEYEKWLKFGIRDDQYDWARIEFADILRLIAQNRNKETNVSRLLHEIKDTRTKLFILDNLYAASFFVGRRGDFDTLRRIVDVASNVYSIEESRLLGLNIPVLERYAHFANQAKKESLVYAGHADEFLIWNGSYTFAEFNKKFSRNS